MANLQILNSKRLTRMALLKETGKELQLPDNSFIKASNHLEADFLKDKSVIKTENGIRRVRWCCSHKAGDIVALQQSETNLPFFAAGFGFASSTLHTILCQAYFAPETMRFADELLSPDPGAASRLMVEPVPFHFHGKQFGELFHCMMDQHDAVVVGLYRCRSALGSPLCYVYTGPEPSTLLYSAQHDRDLMYILSTRPVHQEPPSNKPPHNAEALKRSNKLSVQGVSRGFASPWIELPQHTQAFGAASGSPLQQVTRMSAVLGFSDKDTGYVQPVSSSQSTPLAALRSASVKRTPMEPTGAPQEVAPRADDDRDQKPRVRIPANGQVEEQDNSRLLPPAMSKPQAPTLAPPEATSPRSFAAIASTVASLNAVQLKLQKSPHRRLQPTSSSEENQSTD